MKLARYIIVKVDMVIMSWFTVWLFWIHKPIWRWVFLVLTFAQAITADKYMEE